MNGKMQEPGVTEMLPETYTQLSKGLFIQSTKCLMWFFILNSSQGGQLAS